MAAHRPEGNAVLPISFFKIILKTNLQTLKIPKKFTERYEGDLSNPVFFKPPDGTKWEVYWIKQNGEVWFQKGWKEFAQNYSLDEGHLVVFEYKGTSQFDILILDQSSLEIDYPSCDENENLDENDYDGSVEFLGELPDHKPKQKSVLLSPPPPKKMRGERTSLSLNWPKDARAQEVAEAFISDNPFFTVTIKPRDLVKYKKSVPCLKGYIENRNKCVMLQIGKNSWNVNLLCSNSNVPHGQFSAGFSMCQFSSGWSLFAKENELIPGDVCVFEIINREAVTFQVHVFKGNT